MARPRKHVDTIAVLQLRLSGMSWPAIARHEHLGLGTVYRSYRAAIETLKPYQPRKASNASSGESQAGAELTPASF